MPQQLKPRLGISGDSKLRALCPQNPPVRPLEPSPQLCVPLVSELNSYVL